LRGFNKWAASAVGRQIPFASAKALTKLALEARDEVRAGLKPPRFEIRSTWVSRGITITPAKKSDWPNASSVVGSRDAFMVQQETGGTKQPKFAGALAIPTKAGQKIAIVRRTGAGKIPKRGRPKVLIAAGKAFVKDGEVRLRQAVGTGPGRAPPIFFLRPQAHLRARFEFRKTVEGIVEKRSGPLFREALEGALKPRR
jgi:hypothetical protein